MKRVIAVILTLSILFATNVNTLAHAETQTTVSAHLWEEQPISEEDELKINMLKSQKLMPTLSEEKVVYNGTFDEYDEYYEKLKAEGNKEGGPTFGTTKNNREETDEISEITTKTNSNNGIMTVATSSAYQNTSFNALVRPAFLNGINHPHLNGRAAEEYISTFDGTLQLNFTDVELPGRNGLDLNLGRVYKSEQSFVDLYAGEGYTYTNPTTYLNKRYALGLGWGLNLPSVEVHKDENGTIQATYHDGNGTAYRSNYNDTIRDENGNAQYNGYYIYSSNLDNYPNDNVRFREKDRSYSRGDYKSYFSFTDENNVKEYFSKTGELLAIVDAFGNEITFDYELVRGENLIPFSSYSGNVLGQFSFGRGFSLIGKNEHAQFNGGESGLTGTLSSYIVPIDNEYDEYYANLLYEIPIGVSTFEGEFDFYCDLYNDNNELLGSQLIQHVTPTEIGKVISVDGEFSLNALDLEESPTKARLRLYVDGEEEIYFDDFRLSPKNPLISTITDTVGRTVLFTYGADLYERHSSDEYVDYDILVEIYSPENTRIKYMWYERNKYSYSSSWDDKTISEDEYYLSWGAYDGEYWKSVGYVFKEGEYSNVRWNWTRGYTVDYSGRPYVSTVYNRNSVTYYEYENVNKWFTQSWKQTSVSVATTGYVMTYRVVKRYDVNNVLDSTIGTNPNINVQTFDYTTGHYHDETGYNRRQYDGIFPGELNPLYGKYIVKVTNPSGSIETYEYSSHKYNTGFRRKWKIELPLLDRHILAENTSSTGDTVATEYTYTDNYAIISPTKVKVTETIESESRNYYTVNQYDSDSCLPVMTTLPLTASEVSSIPECKKIYTEYKKISDRYFLLVSEKYYQSENGTQLTRKTEYDTLGRAISQTDEAGNTVYTEYNESYLWLPSRVWYTDPENIGDEDRISEVQYLYEDSLLLGPTTTRTKYGEGKYAQTSATYDTNYGGVRKSTDAKGNSMTYTYDSMGRVRWISYPRYTSTQGNKYVEENFKYSLYNVFNNTYYYSIAKYTYDFDTLVSTQIEYYDDYGNLVYRKTDAGEEEFIYDNKNRPVQYKNYNDFGTDNISASCTYDRLNRITSSTDALGNRNYALYRLLKNEYYFIPSGSIVSENHYSEHYDMYGNVVKTQSYPNGKSATPVLETYTYDLVGNVLTSTDGNGNVTSFEYDALGNNIKTVRADGSIVENEFTKWGTPNKTTVIDGEDRYSTNSDYEDDRGLATSIYSTGLDINTKPWYNEYDVDGSLLKTTAPDSTAMTYLYDKSGNLVQSLNGSQKNTYAYKFDGQIDTNSKYVNDTKTESIIYFYDDRELLVEKAIDRIETVDVTMYTYNTMGNIEVVSSPDNFITWYTRDKAERITKVKTDNKETTYEYFGDGMVKKITYPNSMTAEYTYDNANRVTSIVTKIGSTVVRSYSYTYDGNGNVLTVSGSENVVYTYDSLNQLTSSTKNGVTTVYSYDIRNNLVSETDGTNTKIYEYGGDNRLHKITENGTETVYEYDLNGNLIQRGEDAFAYDENNRLVYSNVNGIETTYEIGVEGLRSSKTTNGETTTYNYNQSGQVLRENEDEFVYGNNLLAKKSEGKYYYYVHNAHGDVTAIVDESGNVVNSYEYDPWGEITSQTETVENGIKYAGEYYDAETGIIYLRNRYYDPATSRMLSEDPAKQGLNWYVYCSNNPVNRIDPSGLKDYVYTSQTDYYVENDWGFWEFLNTDRYYAEIGGSRYQANSKETVTLYDWNSFDTDFLNGTLDSLVSTANTKSTNAKRILSQSVGGDLDFKLQMDKEKLYLANGILYNRNEAGNFVWAYFLESQNYSGYISGALAQGGSIISPMINMNGLPRLDEEWDRQARWSGVKYYYDRNNSWWVYYLLYGGRPKY